ncbi:MAG: UDP-4-amino-4,6-dideoxy-N-acetyl-beta-L-altrosamine transaminase [Candidatus Tectimicrobiota bacterium]
MNARTDTLALHGGCPVRQTPLPYGRQLVDEDDIAAVLDTLRSDWLTTGPQVEAFEQAFAQMVGASEAVAVSNGTAALHAAVYALRIGPGDEVIVPAMTFAASANCVVYQGGTPVFADVEATTLLLDPEALATCITPRTRAILAVDYAGQACAYEPIRGLARQYQLPVIDDACHALGGSYRGQPVGTLAELNTFSFHPVKHMTTGEGGAITTQYPDLARRLRLFRNHGITTDHRQRAANGSYYYEMRELGYNYRLTDLQCALGLSQLRKLPTFVRQRQALAAYYTAALTTLPGVQPLHVRQEVSHAYHLYVVQLDLAQFRVGRETICAALRAEGIGVNVHYLPVHLHPFYQQRFGTGPGLCPVAEAAYERLLTLPLFPQMRCSDADDVLAALTKVTQYYRR